MTFAKILSLKTIKIETVEVALKYSLENLI
jgi:hypothetical protein